VKTCTKCSEQKALTEFYRDVSKTDGLRTDCKACVKGRGAEHRLARLKRVAAYSAEYRRANPHIWWEAGYRQRCRRRGLTPVIGSFTRDDVLAQYGDACFYCGSAPFEELDHHFPVAAGGPHVLDNVRPSCGQCNNLKSNTTDRQLIAELRSA
jgi:5-methylcytosine-specific restriction endonuclease McrA